MNNNIKNIILTVFFAVVLLASSLLCWGKPETEFSESERRLLAPKPELSVETVFSGEFMKNFETYTVDQFPLRDKFRGVKALFATRIMGKKDNNKIFFTDGHLSKIEYPVNPEMTDYAVERFNFLYNTYLKDKNTKIYLSIVPDKNYYIAPQNGYIAIDYDKFIDGFKEKLPYMKYIDLRPYLTAEDYYRTDSHWKQENLTDVAEFLANEMGATAETEYTENVLDNPFKGVYLGQSALNLKPDTIKYLTNDVLENCTVTYYDTGIPKQGPLYNMDKAFGKDPYEMFLSGTTPLVTIENPTAESEKELVIFRDSYASSLAPLLAEGYKKITLVDIRYIQSSFLGSFIEFSNQDVLFLYSTTLLNNSMAMR